MYENSFKFHTNTTSIFYNSFVVVGHFFMLTYSEDFTKTFYKRSGVTAWPNFRGGELYTRGTYYQLLIFCSTITYIIIWWSHK